MRIVIKDLLKKYGKKYAICHLNCEIGPHIYGLMGPNGSGKTTLIRCILQLIHFQKGTIDFIEDDEKIPFTRINFGYLPQVFELFKNLSVYEQLEYFLIIKRVEGIDYETEIHRVLDLVNLSQYANMKCGSLSGGMVRRVGIAQTLLGNPDILIFDEPTLGLDPDERLNIKRILKSVSKNIPIILSTHIIEDVSSICTHGIFIKEGNIIYSGEIDKILNTLENKVYTCDEKDVENIKENVLIRSIDSNTVRIISKEKIDYCFLHQEKPDINDLYQFINHGTYDKNFFED